jgi:hypothetical protein
MRHVLTIVKMAALWGGLVSFGMAEDPKATNSPDNKVEARVKATGNAELREEIHRTLTALIEARSPRSPTIPKLTN